MSAEPPCSGWDLRLVCDVFKDPAGWNKRPEPTDQRRARASQRRKKVVLALSKRLE